MTDLWQRLKQRKLVQWALAYVAAAFALLQGIDIVATKFAWPDSIERILIVAICVGFFIVLLLAWYHGEQGRQRASGTELLLIALVLALGGGLLWHFARVRPADTVLGTNNAMPVSHATSATAPAASSLAPASVVPAIQAKSIAVLPFQNLSEDKGNQYFADGMRDMILTKLAGIGDMKVISRTSTEKYKSRPGNLKTIAAELGVATILEGSVQKSGKQVLINLQLINANTDSHIWAQSYQRTLDNIFGVEGEVAAKVVVELNATMTATEALANVKIPTRSQPAYDAYLRGLYHQKEYLRTFDHHQLKQSIELLQQAVKLDPDFADADAQLARNYALSGENPDEEAKLARRALALDPHNALAHQQLAFVLLTNGDLKGALIETQRAVQLQPNNADMQAGLGVTLAALGRIDDAISAFQRAVALDPRVARQRMVLAVPLLSVRRYAEARDELLTAIAIDPGNLGASTSLADVYRLGWGDLEAAHRVLGKVSTPVASSRLLSENWYEQFLLERNYSKALAALDAGPAEMHPFDAERRAVVYQAEGDGARAKEAFSRARAQLEPLVRAKPDDADLHVRLALSLAGLGKREQANEEAQRAVALTPLAQHPIDGPLYLAALAEVQARTGNTAAAIEQLDRLLEMPAGRDVSVPMLKLDPAWDPIRKDPRFLALLKKYAGPQPPAADSEVNP